MQVGGGCRQRQRAAPQAGPGPCFSPEHHGMSIIFRRGMVRRLRNATRTPCSAMQTTMAPAIYLIVASLVSGTTAPLLIGRSRQVLET